MDTATTDLKASFPMQLRNSLKRMLGYGSPSIGGVRWADFHSTRPIVGGWGYSRGTPVDRYYIEWFLQQWSVDISGRVLEVTDSTYTRRFGADHVTRADVLDVVATNPAATIIADLNDAHQLPTGAFDCIVLTQTLQLIYDFRAAIRELERSLAPGGVLLLTVPGITQVPNDPQRPWYWSFTQASMERLMGEYFNQPDVTVRTLGNIKSVTAFLNGLVREDLRVAELDVLDPVYPMIVTVRAQKAAA